jgi:hypothetical protein
MKVRVLVRELDWMIADHLVACRKLHSLQDVVAQIEPASRNSKKDSTMVGVVTTYSKRRRN